MARKILNDLVKCQLDQSNLSLSIERHLFYKQVSVCLGKLNENSLEELMLEFAREIEEQKTGDDIQACNGKPVQENLL